MSFINDFLNKRKEVKNRAKEYQQEDRIREDIENRKLTHEERLLIKSLREEKDKTVKEALHWDTLKRQAEDRLKSQEMLKFNPEFFRHGQILKQKSMFFNDWGDN